MAYMNQEKKAKIAAALKAIVPTSWKYTLRVRHHSTIVMTIRECPVNLIEAYAGNKGGAMESGVLDLNPYAYEDKFPAAVQAIINGIMNALNTDNFDKSDIQTDYFHVGHYVDVKFGEWKKPFRVAA